jgi:predicted GNAT family acetyltransferase/glutaredoxin
VLKLHQAEWCPFSAAARELLTELGLPFVAVQVEPQPEQRATLRKRFGTDEIPVLETDDGAVFRGTREIFAYLTSLPPSPQGREHRARYAEHQEARVKDVTGHLLRHAEPPDVQVRDSRGESRYELVREGEVIGHATYRLEGDRLVVPYVEVDPQHEGRGYGSTLCAGLLDDARARGLTVVPSCPFLAWYMERNPVQLHSVQ